MSDYLEIIIKAEITLLTTIDGGRKTPIKSGYRPNHKFDDNSYYSGQIEFHDTSYIYPGETHIVKIIFMESPHLIERLNIGYEWELTEGGHLIGKSKQIEELKRKN